MSKTNITTEETKFLNLIKKSCQSQMELNNIQASVIGALAITESSWGTVEHVKNTNNLFRVLINESETEWFGKCYSIDSNSMYETKDDCTSGDTLIRVYDSYDQCIEDHINNLIMKRRSEGGPFKYSNIKGTNNYKSCIKNLIKAGYQADHLCDYKDPAYESTLISIIEKYNLFKWDSNSNVNLSNERYAVKMDADTDPLFNTTKFENAEYMASTNKGYKVFNGTTMILDPWVVTEEDPMYRVRLSWDRSDTQINATKILEDAIRTASFHTGYKVFDDKGIMISDPWKEPEKINPNGINNISVIRPGDVVMLSNTPVYKTTTDVNPFIFLTGKFYYYDNNIINNRCRITKTNDKQFINGKDPSKIIGFIKL